MTREIGYSGGALTVENQDILFGIAEKLNADEFTLGYMKTLSGWVRCVRFFNRDNLLKEMEYRW